MQVSTLETHIIVAAVLMPTALIITFALYLLTTTAHILLWEKQGIQGRILMSVVLSRTFTIVFWFIAFLSVFLNWNVTLPKWSCVLIGK